MYRLTCVNVFFPVVLHLWLFSFKVNIYNMSAVLPPGLTAAVPVLLSVHFSVKTTEVELCLYTDTAVVAVGLLFKTMKIKV